MNQTSTNYSELKDQPYIGVKRRFNNMKRRLSIGFSQTRQQRDNDGMLSYAQNRNSKGRLVPIFVTLTYPDNSHWNPQDITNYCKKMNQYAQRNWGIKLRYFWVAETTKNGVIHYHYTTWVPRNSKLPKPSEKQYINGREYPAPWSYRAKVEGVRKGVYSYLLKYLSKGSIIDGLGIEKRIDNKIVKPRLFGFGGFDTDQREYMSYCMLPKYVKEHFWSVEYGDKVQRVKGGWRLKRANPVSKVWNYYKYGDDTLMSNFDLWVNELNGHKIIGYDFGGHWSPIPEPSTADIFVPF